MSGAKRFTAIEFVCCLKFALRPRPTTAWRIPGGSPAVVHTDQILVAKAMFGEKRDPVTTSA